MANLSNINGKFVVEQTTGYVGVGTTDPNYPIEVLNASAEIALNALGGSIYRVQSDSASNFIIRKDGVGDRLVINSAGNATFAGSINAQDMRLQSSGTAYLNIGNNLTGSASTDGASIGYFTGETSLQIVQRENDAIEFSTNGNKRMRIDSSGNMQFNGSTTISSNTADGTDNAQIIITGGGASGDTRGASVHLAGNENGNGGLMQLRAGDGSVGGIRLYEGGSERMRIAAGNTIIRTSTSIGTTVSPTRTLDVRGTGLNIFGSGGNTELMLRGQVEGTGTVRNLGAFHLSIRGDEGGNNDDLKFLRFINGSYGGIAMQIQNTTGNVGIGTSLPERILHLDADQGRAIIQLDKGGDKIISMGTGSSATGADDTILQLINEGVEKVRIFTEGDSYFNGGNVGIGTTSPIAQLDIGGNVSQHHSSSTNNNGGWKNIQNLGVAGWLDQTYSAGRIKVFGLENGNVNVSYCEYYVIRSSTGYHIQQIGTRLDVGNTHGHAEVQVSGSFLQIRNVAQSSLGVVRIVFSGMKD